MIPLVFDVRIGKISLTIGSAQTNE
jgi:hypothetical protein